MAKRSNRRNFTPNPAEWHDRTADEALDDAPEPPEPLGLPEAGDDDLGPTTVYYLHDAEHTLLYVGITLSSLGLRRMAQHSKDKDWWTDVAYASMEHLPSRVAAEAREAQAIAHLNPLYNVARPKVTEYGVRLCGCGCRRPAPPAGKGLTRSACRQRMYRAGRAS